MALHEEIKELKQIFYNFIWNSKKDLVNRNTLILPYEKKVETFIFVMYTMYVL